MNFLIDSQLPEEITTLLQSLGCDAIFVDYLPKGNKTPDQEILKICESEQRIFITKDEDFIQSFILKKQPPLLIFVHPTASHSRLTKLLHLRMDYLISVLNSHGIFVLE